MPNFQYPKAGLNSPAGVRQSIQKFRRLPIVQKMNTPLLYFLLGDGTPSYKMDPVDAAYQNQPMGQQQCSNCSSSYQHVTSEQFICDQIWGNIAPSAWCRLWRP